VGRRRAGPHHTRRCRHPPPPPRGRTPWPRPHRQPRVGRPRIWLPGRRPP
jgi:hypothetical protein